MSYDGEYDASEYPDGIYAPRFGYKGSRALDELAAKKDAEIKRIEAERDFLVRRIRRHGGRVLFGDFTLRNGQHSTIYVEWN